MTYQETCEYLYKQMPMFERQGAAGYKEGLANTLALDEHFGHPHRAYATIHVGGTNGKGSVSHTIAALLQEVGYRVGLYTSPHLVDFSERIRVNGRPIHEDYVVNFVRDERAFFEPLSPSFFEVTTALAFKYFKDMDVDIAVVEVGLGGRLDCTNIITPILSVITNISFDHTQFLGNTLAKIAAEKAGIIKPGVPVVIGESHPQTMNVFLAKAQECGSEIYFADQCEYLRRTRLKTALECELKGNYQEHNLQTAFVALRELGIKNEEIRKGFEKVCTMTGLRGRWEVLQERPLVICDTGHNSHGIQYVARQLKDLQTNQVWLVFGMVNDKDTEVVMRLLPAGERYHYIFTRPNTSRARDAQEMLNLWGKEGVAIEDPQEALTYAFNHAAPEDAIFIGGSNYLVGEALSKRYQSKERPSEK